MESQGDNFIFKTTSLIANAPQNLAGVEVFLYDRKSIMQELENLKKE